jgi:hypothetical protein
MTLTAIGRLMGNDARGNGPTKSAYSTSFREQGGPTLRYPLTDSCPFDILQSCLAGGDRMPFYELRRRAFISLLGGAAAWPLAASAQQPERMRRIGVLVKGSADDADEQARLTAFLQGLQEWGWSDGRNVHIDVRWSAADSNRRRRYAAELVALSPDVILADTSAVVAALQQATNVA